MKLARKYFQGILTLCAAEVICPVLRVCNCLATPNTDHSVTMMIMTAINNGNKK